MSTINLHAFRTAKYFTENPVKLSKNLAKLTVVHGTRGFGHTGARYDSLL